MRLEARSTVEPHWTVLCSLPGELATVCSASVGAPRPEGAELEWAPEARHSS